ncbi:putative ABC transport system permease protein [Candidatus Thermokryptus mobilis]|uniref:Putative ABC transport system permease protein n=1 Tax=Candidatus Thermokryptus mobilis TaxID=1643428 RepID=A0A0S4MPK9_9BACT|nr:ABC transporter permease [Candidatus Thermokryptus mobilis]CUU00729.1 putative ABC transport system permease protein [Candidatus Thermokryptus mobilis]
MRFTLQLKESFKSAFQSILAHKLRSSLTTLGVVIGIVSVTLMNMAIEGLRRAFETSISAIGADVLYIQKWPWFTGEDWWKYRNRREIQISYAKYIKERSTYAVAVAPTISSFDATVRYGGNVLKNTVVVGTTDEFIYTSGVSVELGRFMSEIEVKAERPVCVIGAEIAEKLFMNVNPIGRELKIAGRSFRVVGVLEKQGKFLGLASLDDRIYIPIGQFIRIFPWRAGTTINVKVRDMNEIEDAIEELRGIMRTLRQLKPWQEDDFSINRQELFLNAYNQTVGIIGAVGLGITILALVVGGIGIMNIMFVSVKERTREIGIRKAVGATRRAILMQFLIEAILIGLFGGVIGLIFAILLGFVVDQVIPTSLPLWVAFLSLLISIFVGIIAGFIPAYRASKVDPVESLRYE